MIRKKWTGGEPVLSVETKDGFWKALALGLPIELSPEIAEGIGLIGRGRGYPGRDYRNAGRSLYAPRQTLRDLIKGCLERWRR